MTSFYSVSHPLKMHTLPNSIPMLSRTSTWRKGWRTEKRHHTLSFTWHTDATQKAEKDFSEALIFAPENKTYIAQRADVRAEQKLYELALSDINHLLNREPKSAALHFEKGTICLRSADTICALQSFEYATAYDSQNPANWSALGLVQLMLAQETEALQSLNQSIELGSKWAGDYINRGIIYYRMHNYRGALADYDKAVSLSPRNAQCYYNREAYLPYRQLQNNEAEGCSGNS